MLDIGNIYENYIEDPLHKELRKKDSMYYLSAKLSYIFTDFLYSYLSDDDLVASISKDIQTKNTKLFASKLVERINKDGWPIISIENNVPMTLFDFVSAISSLLLNNIQAEEVLEKYANMIEILSIAEVEHEE